MSDIDYDHLNITNDELNRFSKAFKSDEFRALFADYCKEITDPENRRAYEAELKQLEAERGIDVSFINPEPGFVIKTSLNDNQKVFINVAQCDQIERPTSEYAHDKASGSRGLNWKIPYAQSKVKRDFDKNRILCPVYDVVFHPDTLHLAAKNVKFKKLVIDTACDAVQSTFNVRLDLSNLKFPKLGYKGAARPTIIRKKNGEVKAHEPSLIDHIYPAPPNDVKVKESKMNMSKKVAEYATPKYEIVHRRDIQLHEMTDELDSKINITVPKELLIKINLPLLNSSKDALLDVNRKSISILSENPAKYKLDIALPFEVDKFYGKAQFDSDKRILMITLPVVQQKELMIADLLNKNSDAEKSLEPADDFFEDKLHAIQKNVKSGYKHLDKVPQLQSTFLCPNISYTLPKFTFNHDKNIITFKLNVENVQPDSISMQNDNKSFKLKFTSIGTGYFPVHYAFYFSTQFAMIVSTPRAETSDTNLIIQIELDSVDSIEFYEAGLNKNNCKKCTFSNST